ncbi:MAG: YbjQ family protein [Rhizobacter sp.]
MASIRARERELQAVIALNTRYVPEGVVATQAAVVMGSVVVSSDYFKTFVAGFRNLFGGRFRGYESLLERARREALLRMKLRARETGSNLVIGVRFHTTSISGSQTPSVEVMAYGTAVKTAR